MFKQRGRGRRDMGDGKPWNTGILGSEEMLMTEWQRSTDNDTWEGTKRTHLPRDLVRLTELLLEKCPDGKST